jgi:hypothetical protein
VSAPAPVAAPAPAAAPAAPAAPAAAPAPAATPQPSGGQIAPTQNSFSGHLDAGSGGHFALYEFTYPGNREVYTINMQASPDNGQVLGETKAGFKVYGPVKDKVYVIGGVQPGLQPNVTGNLISLDPGTYVVQVFNYNPGVAIDYTISLIAGPRPGEDGPTPVPA